MNNEVVHRAAKAEVFWGEMAPSEHIAQFYEDDNVLLDTLSGFIIGGLKSGESAIVLATGKHLEALNQRIGKSGLDLAALQSQDQYIPLVAENALTQFMVEQWPDDKLFTDFVTELISRARGNGRRVRAFGELVALLWAGRNHAATVRLEFLWHQVCKKQEFSLFCAYPRAGFTQDAADSLNEICATHSKII